MGLVEARKSFLTVKGQFFQLFATLLISIIILLLTFMTDDLPVITDMIPINRVCNRALEVFLLIVSFSIFFVSCFTYSQTKNNHSLIAGFTFLAGGIFYWIMIVKLPAGLAIAESADYPKNSFLIWTLIRLINGICFSILLSIRSDNDNKVFIKRRYLFLGTAIIVVSGYLFIRMPSVKPELLMDKDGLTTISVILTSFIAVLYIYTFIRAMKVFRKTGDVVYKALSNAFMLMFFSEAALLTIKQINDLKSVMSQLFLTVSYAFMFYAFYIQNIRRPYLLLTKAKEELDGYLTELDNLVDQRTNELRCMNEKLMADQEIAREMQLSMLPSDMPVNENVTFSSGYIPAENLSGDFYNVFRIDDYQYGVCVGDVSGHGVSAAMLSIFTFQKMQSLMEETGVDGMTIPSMVLKHIYESFNAANFNDDMYIVMLYGVFNTQSGIFSYASGGLNTIPLRIRPDGSIQELDNDGFAICKLGSLLKPKFVNHQVLLFPGDKLILYTDGLIDARNSEGEKYSITRLKKIIQKYNKWGAERITQALTYDIKKFAGEKPADDVTFLVLDVLPPF